MAGSSGGEMKKKQRKEEGTEVGDDMWGLNVSGWRENRGSRGSLDHTEIQRPASGPRSIKYVQNGTSQANNEL